MLGRLADSEIKKAKKAVASLFTLREASQNDRLCLQRFRHARRMARQSQRREATKDFLAEGNGYTTRLLSFINIEICNNFLYSRETKTDTAELIKRLESRVDFLEAKCDALQDREAELSELIRELTAELDQTQEDLPSPPICYNFAPRAGSNSQL